MSAESPALIRSFKVGKRTCTLIVPSPPAAGDAACLVAEWSPTVPRRLSKKEMRQYRKGRDEAIMEVTRQTGAPTVLFDI